MANMLPHKPDGRLSSLVDIDGPDALDKLKTRVLAGLVAGKGLYKAVQEAGNNWGTVWRLRETDPEFGQTIEHWRRGVGLKAVALMDDTLEHPALYEEGLKYSGWSNFAMINAKAAFPDMRDSAQINVNVDARTAIGDWQAAVQAARQAEEPNPGFGS
jgi:hypothetical protein